MYSWVHFAFAMLYILCVYSGVTNVDSLCVSFIVYFLGASLNVCSFEHLSTGPGLCHLFGGTISIVEMEGYIKSLSLSECVRSLKFTVHFVLCWLGFVVFVVGVGVTCY
jgi:hypothetical protein